MDPNGREGETDKQLEHFKSDFSLRLENRITNWAHIPFLQEWLATDVVLSHRRRFPGEVGSLERMRKRFWRLTRDVFHDRFQNHKLVILLFKHRFSWTYRWIALKQTWLAVIPAGDQQRYAERSHTAWLGVLLHDVRHSLHQLRSRNRHRVHKLILLCDLTGLAHQQSIVRTHARVDHADVSGDRLDLVNAVLLEQHRFVFLFGGQHYAIARLDAGGRSTWCDRGQCVFDLD